MREKMIELLDDAPLSVNWDSHDYPDTDSAADILIANDVVPVVRCKNCKHWIERTADGIDTFHICWFTESIASKNHFCAYGERKDNATN